MTKKQTRIRPLKDQKYLLAAARVHGADSASPEIRELAKNTAVEQYRHWQEGFNELRSGWQEVQALLDANNVSGPMRAIVRAMFNKLKSMTSRYTDEQLSILVPAVVEYFKDMSKHSIDNVLDAVAAKFGYKPSQTA